MTALREKHVTSVGKTPVTSVGVSVWKLSLAFLLSSHIVSVKGSVIVHTQDYSEFCQNKTASLS